MFSWLTSAAPGARSGCRVLEVERDALAVEGQGPPPAPPVRLRTRGGAARCAGARRRLRLGFRGRARALRRRPAARPGPPVPVPLRHAVRWRLGRFDHGAAAGGHVRGGSMAGACGVFSSAVVTRRCRRARRSACRRPSVHVVTRVRRVEHERRRPRRGDASPETRPSPWKAGLALGPGHAGPSRSITRRGRLAGRNSCTSSGAGSARCSPVGPRLRVDVDVANGDHGATGARSAAAAGLGASPAGM